MPLSYWPVDIFIIDDLCGKARSIPGGATHEQVILVIEESKLDKPRGASQ